MKMKKADNKVWREGDIFKKFLKWGSRYKMALGVKKSKYCKMPPPSPYN